MTKPLPFTEASIRRRVRALRAEGLRVKGVANDGTVLVDDGEKPPADVAPAEDSALDEWRTPK